ncbi:hypothetical protein QYF61_021755 [Mycteria americana]|uniref:Uncharacterized protein n=1 Tax=Mycteria americana TaxID=33587 RepID=A0AAN7NBM1_MYCAM|nr:hypothetical protein QYF61_021755 [Mycteria americana]
MGNCSGEKQCLAATSACAEPAPKPSRKESESEARAKADRNAAACLDVWVSRASGARDGWAQRGLSARAGKVQEQTHSTLSCGLLGLLDLEYEKFFWKTWREKTAEELKIGLDDRLPQTLENKPKNPNRLAFKDPVIRVKQFGESQTVSTWYLVPIDSILVQIVFRLIQPIFRTTVIALQERSEKQVKGGSFKGWRLNHFPGQPVQMLDNPFSEEKLPNIQSKPPLAQLKAISSCPITCYLGEETDPHLSTTSSQTKEPQFPQPLLIRLVLQTLHQLRCPSLHTLQHLHVPLVVMGPKRNTVFEIDTPAQFGVICKLTEGALDPFVQIIDKDIKQNWPQHRALGNTTCDRPPTGVNSIHHHSLGPAIQPVLYPAKSTPVQAMSSQFLQENAVGNRDCNMASDTANTVTVVTSSMVFSSSAVTFQGWRLNHFPGQSVPMLDNPLGEEKFPNIQSKPPLAQLEAISSCPITCYLGEETDPHLSTTSFQAKQSQLPQPLLIRLLLQTLHQLRRPSLYALQYLNIPLVVGGPKLNTVFEVRPHQCRVQGHNHFPSPAGHAIFDTGQDAIGLLGRLGTLLAHIQAAVNQHPQVLLCQAAFQPLFPKPVALHGVAVAQVQDLALGLVKPHTIHPSPSIQPVQVPLQSLPTLQQINTPTQLGVVCKLTESALDPFVQIIDKDVKQNWPQHRALGNTACDRPPTGAPRHSPSACDFIPSAHHQLVTSTQA